MQKFKKDTFIKNAKSLRKTLKEHENIKRAILKKKNKAIAKYL